MFLCFSWSRLMHIINYIYNYICGRATQLGLVLVDCACVKLSLYLWSAKIFEMKMHRVSIYTKDAHRELLHKGQLPVVLQHDYNDPGQLQDD